MTRLAPSSALARPPTMIARRLASVLALLAAAESCGSDARPSVILVSIDTLRADHVGLYGYERDTTPFLDRWAERCVVFERAFSPCPWTLIAHMTMLTGLYPSQHGVVADDLALSEDIPLLAERMKRAGYRTVGLYRECWIHGRYGFGRGFDVFRSHADAEEAGEHLREELERLDPGRPFFLFLHLFDVHNGVSGAGTELLYPSPEPYQDLFLDGSAAPLPDLPPEELWTARGPLTEAQLRTVVAHYDGGIRHVDAKLEEWFGWLERGGWLANALVIVTADHGESLGQRGRLDGHGGFAQEGLHVPLLARHPRELRAGTRVSEIVHLGDIVPTILEAAGEPADPRLSGRTLFGPLPPDRVVTGSYPPSDYVVRWPEKIMHVEGGRCVAVDMERDPLELHPRRTGSERYEELSALAFPRGPVFPPPRKLDALPEAEREALRALGYGGVGDE